MKKLLAFLAALAILVVIVAAPAAAVTLKATWSAVTIDTNTVSTIVAIVNSVVVCAAMALLSKKWSLSTLGVYGLSIAICALCSAGYLAYLLIVQSQAWSWSAFVGYWAAVSVVVVGGDSLLLKAGGITTS